MANAIVSSPFPKEEDEAPKSPKKEHERPAILQPPAHLVVSGGLEERRAAIEKFEHESRRDSDYDSKRLRSKPKAVTADPMTGTISVDY